MEQKDTGILLNKQDISLHRTYFDEMVRLLGVRVIYRAPRENMSYNGYGELDNFFYEPILTGCIFEEHPSQKSMKKLGWISELSTESSLIHVPYDLPRIAAGALFIIPSALDNAEGRVFRVNQLSTSMIYPASITCEIVPEYKNNCTQSNIEDFSQSNFNLLFDENNKK